LDDIDISGKQTKSVKALFEAGKKYNYIITVCSRSVEEKTTVEEGPGHSEACDKPQPQLVDGIVDRMGLYQP
jgi:hypothetical protein